MNNKLLSRIIKLASNMCPTNRELRTSHVSFLVKNGKIKHIGWNKHRTHPESLKHPYHDGNVYIHAELDVCIKSEREDLSDFEIVVIRIDRNNNMCNSRPCRGCQSVLKQFGIKHVYYSTNKGTIEKM